MSEKKLIFLLTLAFPVLMSVPWLVPHTGLLALVAFVPLLCAERLASHSGFKRFWILYFSAFIQWNAATTFWVCNATVGGGIFAIVYNSLLMSLVFGLFRLSQRRLRGILPYILLATAWIAGERLYFRAQISWPWLDLGNAFAGSTRLVQWYNITGPLGGSLWVWAVNLGLFGLMVALSEGRTQLWNAKARAAAYAGIGLIIIGPIAASLIMYARPLPQAAGSADVLVGQPNFDPYHKFEAMSQSQQTDVLLGLYDRELAKSDSEYRNAPDLLMAPETFTSDVILNDIKAGKTWNSLRDYMDSLPSTDILFGASSYRFCEKYPGPLARRSGGQWYLNYNSALLLDRTGRTEVFHKSKLVVGVEQTPYPGIFTKLDDKLGGVMGRCSSQPEISLLHLHDSIPFGCAVCYESVYGEYCTDYVRKGAQFMTVITNDAWWGDTPGYRQHLNYSALRAIELGRDIARCANTGISAFIDRKGVIVSASEWWKAQTLRGKVSFYSDVTPFVKYGDVTGKVCTLVFLFLLLAFAVRIK